MRCLAFPGWRGLVFVFAAADEFADEGAFGDDGVVFDGVELVEEFVDAAGTDVGVLAFGVVAEFFEGFGKVVEEAVLEEGELEGHGAVDEVVGGTDEGDDVL